MESRNFDRFSRAFTQSYNRRDALRLLGLATIGASSASLLAPASSDAKPSPPSPALPSPSPLSSPT